MRKTVLRARRAEEKFARALRSLARRCGEYAKQMYDPKDPIGSAARLKALLASYAQTIRPWARVVAENMVLDVARRDEAYWA